jgi:hypothetical protein
LVRPAQAKVHGAGAGGRQSKVLARAFPSNWIVGRKSTDVIGKLGLFENGHYRISIMSDMFPSINPGKFYTLAEIAGCEDE